MDSTVQQAPFIGQNDSRPERPPPPPPPVEMRPMKTLRDVWLREGKETLCLAWVDLRVFRWKKALYCFLLLAWVGCLFAALGSLPFMTGSITTYNKACSPSAVFRIDSGGSEIWDINGFFQVTLFGSADYTFTEAKLIDVAWDVIVGRGGQAALAWFSWKVFSTYVATSMQVQPVTLETFWVVFFGHEPNIMMVSRIVRDFWARRRLVSRLAMSFMVFSMIFIIVFPTLVGAMTGYTPVTRAFVADKLALIPYSEFQSVVYTVHDGARINLTNDYHVKISRYYDDDYDYDYVRRDGHDDFSYDRSMDRCSRYLGGDSGYTFSFLLEADCFLRGNLSEYTSKYGFFGLVDKESVWQGKTLAAPALNISATSLAEKQPDFGWNWTDPRTQQMPFADSSLDSQLLTAKTTNATYTGRYVLDNGQCRPMDRYKWGFSAWQLAIVLTLLVVWTFGSCVMWFKAYFTLKTRGSPEVPGRYKSALLFASALKMEFVGDEKDWTVLSEDQLHELLARHKKGGAVTIDASSSLRFSLRKGIWGWCKREKWGLMMLVPCVGLGVAVLYGRPPFDKMAAHFFYAWSMCAAVSILIAVIVGRSTRTRIFHFGSCMLIGVFIILIVGGVS